MDALTDIRTRLPRREVKALVGAIEEAEQAIVSTIERECEALRSGRMLAAWALRERLRDAARLYAGAVRAARGSLAILGNCDDAAEILEDRRLAFGALLKVEFAILAAERAAARVNGELGFGGPSA